MHFGHFIKPPYFCNIIYLHNSFVNSWHSHMLQWFSMWPYWWVLWFPLNYQARNLHWDCVGLVSQPHFGQSVRMRLTVATLLWPSVGVKPNTWRKWGFGVLKDSRMFRVRQKGSKHLALRCSWCHWKGLEA